MQHHRILRELHLKIAMSTVCYFAYYTFEILDEFLSIYTHTELVIGLTSGALLVCIAFLIFAILCSITIWCIRRKHTSFICDGRKDSSAVDMVVYDVPVFAINSVTANKQNALQNSMTCEDLIINQNIAYGKVCKKT